MGYAPNVALELHFPHASSICTSPSNGLHNTVKMDWQRSLLGRYGMSKATEPEDGEVEEVDDNEEDFYGSHGQEEEREVQVGATEGVCAHHVQWKEIS